jgi:hypothetical protein
MAKPTITLLRAVLVAVLALCLWKSAQAKAAAGYLAVPPGAPRAAVHAKAPNACVAGESSTPRVAARRSVTPTTCSPSNYVLLTKDSIGSRDVEEIPIHGTYRAVDGIRRDRDRGDSGSVLVRSSGCDNLEQSHSATAGSHPRRVNVPSGNKLAGSFEGQGEQIYKCTNDSWALSQPAAIISDNGNPIALHSKGPVWISTVDGSEVGATPVPGAIVNHDDAIPELLLKATENHGAGQFGSVTYIQRLATKGGLTPKGPCADGTRVSIPYSASYLFYTAG